MTEINNGFSLDNLLDGGFFTKELTEIYGPPASGKTQVSQLFIQVKLFFQLLQVWFFGKYLRRIV